MWRLLRFYQNYPNYIQSGQDFTVVQHFAREEERCLASPHRLWRLLACYQSSGHLGSLQQLKKWGGFWS